MTWQKKGMLVIVERNLFFDCAIYRIRVPLIKDQCLQEEIYCRIILLSLDYSDQGYTTFPP